MRELREQFKETSIQRKKYRGQIIRILRQYKNLFYDDGWILRKMEFNYMGDLSDSQLEYYLKFVIENRSR